MKQLLHKLVLDYPQLSFQHDDGFYWNPRKNTVHYDAQVDSHEARWSLLHELSHGILGHSDYSSDFHLLLIEASAWSYAASLQQKYDKKHPIDDDHIQDCLDTYRDWLHSRSTCPKCDQVGIQESKLTYRCINCLASWHVSTRRFSRPYRLCSLTKTKTSPVIHKSKQMKFYKKRCN